MPKSKPEKNISRFSEDTSEFGGYVYTSTSQLSSKLANEHITEITLTLANLQGKSIFDIGCGDGTYTLELFKKGRPKNILGIDPVAVAVKAAKERNNDSRISFCVGNIYSLPKNKKYDLAVVRGVLHHLYQPEKALKEIAGVANEVLIIEPNGYNPVLKIIEKISKYHVEHEEKSYPPHTLDRWIKKSGGLIRRRKFGGFVPFFCPDWLARCLKFFEPLAESLPLLNRFICGNYYIMYDLPVIKLK